MNNKKGFTLIELLVTIGLLTLLITMVSISFFSLFNKKNQQLEDEKEKEFEKLVQIYVENNVNISNENCYFMSLKDLKDNDLISEYPKISTKQYKNTNGVKIIYNNSASSFEYKYLDSNSTCISINNINNDNDYN